MRIIWFSRFFFISLHKAINMEEKITFELNISQVDEIVNSLNKAQDDLYKEQLAASMVGNHELRDKLLNRFMNIQTLISLFELKKMNHGNN